MGRAEAANAEAFGAQALLRNVENPVDNAPQTPQSVEKPLPRPAGMPGNAKPGMVARCMALVENRARRHSRP